MKAVQKRTWFRISWFLSHCSNVIINDVTIPWNVVIFTYKGRCLTLTFELDWKYNYEYLSIVPYMLHIKRSVIPGHKYVENSGFVRTLNVWPSAVTLTFNVWGHAFVFLRGHAIGNIFLTLLPIASKLFKIKSINEKVIRWPLWPWTLI